MLSGMVKEIKTALLLLVLFSILTGLIYPLAVTIMSQLIFPWRTHGSLIEINGKKVGSALIGQSFTDAKYFWGRPSATTPFPYNAESSNGSNLGPSNPDLLSAVKTRIDTLLKIDSDNKNVIPIDLVTASGSGLDPEISPAAAFYQVSRIAKSRGIAENEIQNLIKQLIKNRDLGILGEPRVKVLELNLALDNLSQPTRIQNVNKPT